VAKPSRSGLEANKAVKVLGTAEPASMLRLVFDKAAVLAAGWDRTLSPGAKSTCQLADGW